MTQEPELEWSARLALAVAGEVRRHRQAKGWSAQQLSERCAEVGMPIQRSVLANMESGRRTTVTIAEILVLAAALEIPPVSLIYPVGYEVTFEGLPGAVRDTYEWAFWMTGEDPLTPSPDSKLAEVAEAVRLLKSNPLNMARQIEREMRTYLNAFQLYTERMEQSLQSVKANSRDLELYSLAMDEMEAIMERREAVLSLIEEERDPEKAAQASERMKALRNQAEAAADRARSLKARLDKYHDDREELEVYRRRVEKAKASVVNVVEEMESQGWIVPELPFSLDDLRKPLGSVLD
jgi:transcriptional regulator with XRE-family HTH domain